MAMQSHNKKKPTKKQAMANIVNHYDSSLKENFIKNIVIGFETASKLYLDKINEGCTIEELKIFIENNIKNIDIIEKVAKGEDKNVGNNSKR